jgi:hypothetical protein
MIPDNWKDLAERDRARMTVGIAATCDLIGDAPKIIMCADWQVMSHLGSAQTAFKFWTLGRGWHCMYSGAPHSARALIKYFSEKIIRHKGVIDESNIKVLIGNALRERKNELCNEFTQGRFALSYQDFLSKGKASLPDVQFNSACRAIENLVLGADFLIVGYASNYPLILETDQYARIYIRESFATIGEGGHLAHSSLMHRQHDESTPLDLALYSVFEAKKWAERNKTVGDETSLQILYRGNKYRVVTKDGLKFLEKQFKKYGPKKVSKNLSLQENMLVDGVELKI